MSPLVVLAVVFVIATIIGMPLFVAVGITTAVGIYMIDIPYTLIAQTSYGSLTPFPLLTIPLFVLAGRLMEVGGMANRMIGIATKLVGAYRGSMGLVTVFACALFAALSGSGPATTAAIGSVTVPAMKRDGYDVPFAAGITAAGGALGSLIPPSNLLIIYGLVSDTSIPRLFLAGILPGVLITGLLMITTYVIARKRGYGGGGDAFSWRPFLKAAWDGKWSIGAPVLILGGIYGGILVHRRTRSNPWGYLWWNFYTIRGSWRRSVLFVDRRAFYLSRINVEKNYRSPPFHRTINRYLGHHRTHLGIWPIDCIL